MANKIKTLYQNDWLSLKEVDGYIYSHETRCQGKIVSVLVVDSSKPGKYFIRREICPCHFDGMADTSITGGYEQGDKPVDSAIRELKEEGGYDATEDEMESLGTVRPSKSTDSIVHLFYVDVAGKEQSEITGDGSEGEKNTEFYWGSLEDAINCKDPLMGTALVRYLASQNKIKE